MLTKGSRDSLDLRNELIVNLQNSEKKGEDFQLLFNMTQLLLRMTWLLLKMTSYF